MCVCVCVCVCVYFKEILKHLTFVNSSSTRAAIRFCFQKTLILSEADCQKTSVKRNNLKHLHITTSTDRAGN